MRGMGRILVVGVLWAAGCVDQTFDLLPKPGQPSSASAGSGTTGGAAGRSSAGRSGSGGTGTPAGRGAGGSAGTTVFGDAGSGDDTQCGPSGCSHCSKHAATGCVDCRVDDDCANVPGRPHCSQYSGCVECRSGIECPNATGCDTDCAADYRCDYQTDMCQPDCIRQQPCPASRPTCDTTRGVCLECNPSLGFVCAYGLFCSRNGECIECMTSYDCKPSAPVCEDSMCRACMTDDECNPPGQANVPGARVCDHGTCEMPAAPQP
ncbi:MAG TPA: hypothetical protein VMI54_26000 [Polyangiaceae bacterium]|nr:hypothetical protein [Polyangiaceae bacterium]